MRSSYTSNLSLFFANFGWEICTWRWEICKTETAHWMSVYIKKNHTFSRFPLTERSLRLYCLGWLRNLAIIALRCMRCWRTMSSIYHLLNGGEEKSSSRRKTTCINKPYLQPAFAQVDRKEILRNERAKEMYLKLVRCHVRTWGISSLFIIFNTVKKAMV